MIQFYWGWREISAGRPAAAYVLHAHTHTLQVLVQRWNISLACLSKQYSLKLRSNNSFQFQFQQTAYFCWNWWFYLSPLIYDTEHRRLKDIPHGFLVWLSLWWNMAYLWPSNSTLVTAFVTRNLFPWQTLWHFHSSRGQSLPNCLIFHGCPIRQYVLLFLSFFLRLTNAPYVCVTFSAISTSTI